MKLRTSAKINLNLEIFSEKQDSLHKLSSLMIPIDLYDDIKIEESINENIKFSDGNLNNIESTIHKALKLIRKNNPSFDKSFDIYIDKKIPYNSGLGGGSSDAGALIRYLCDNYELDLPSNLEIVREVGSDVPFFIQGVSAVIQGIGEIVEPLPPVIFSTSPTTPTALILAFLSAKFFINPTTTAEPAISYVISSINFAGFNEIPPVSKQTPFPTNAKGLDLEEAPFHSIVTR